MLKQKLKKQQKKNDYYTNKQVIRRVGEKRQQSGVLPTGKCQLCDKRP